MMVPLYYLYYSMAGDISTRGGAASSSGSMEREPCRLIRLPTPACHLAFVFPLVPFVFPYRPRVYTPLPPPLPSGPRQLVENWRGARMLAALVSDVLKCEQFSVFPVLAV